MTFICKMSSRAKWLGYCKVGLMSVCVNVRLGYCPVGLTSSQTNVYYNSVCELLSGQVTVTLQSGYSPVGWLSGRVTFCGVSVHQSTVCRGCILNEAPVELVPDRATVQIPFLISVLWVLCSASMRV